MADRHPIEVIEALRRRYGHDLELIFTRYEIGASGDQERQRRTDFRASADSLDAAWLVHELGRLGPAEELALHSMVALGADTGHIPMLDFSDAYTCDVAEQLCRQAIAETCEEAGIDDAQVFIYSSGRSHHAYADILVPADRWQAFMGGLFLLDPPDSVPLVDVRWAGHALRRGYAALRWSRNTSRYLAAPG